MPQMYETGQKVWTRGSSTETFNVLRLVNDCKYNEERRTWEYQLRDEDSHIYEKMVQEIDMVGFRAAPRLSSWKGLTTCNAHCASITTSYDLNMKIRKLLDQSIFLKFLGLLNMLWFSSCKIWGLRTIWKRYALTVLSVPLFFYRISGRTTNGIWTGDVFCESSETRLGSKLLR